MTKENETSSILKGCAATKLATVIPIENIKIYLQLYYLLRNISLKEIKDADFPPPEIAKVIVNVKSLGKKKWLSTDDVEYLIEQILNRIFHGAAAQKEVRKHCAAAEIRSLGNMKNKHFKILLYALVYDAILYSKRGSYELIYDFLDEINIEECTAISSHDELSREYRRLSFDKTAKYLSNYLLIDPALWRRLTIPDYKPGFLAKWSEKYCLAYNFKSDNSSNK